MVFRKKEEEQICIYGTKKPFMQKEKVFWLSVHKIMVIMNKLVLLDLDKLKHKKIGGSLKYLAFTMNNANKALYLLATENLIPRGLG